MPKLGSRPNNKYGTRTSHKYSKRQFIPAAVALASALYANRYKKTAGDVHMSGPVSTRPRSGSGGSSSGNAGFDHLIDLMNTPKSSQNQVRPMAVVTSNPTQRRRTQGSVKKVGFLGRFSGKFKTKGRKPKHKSLARIGVVLRNEQGGTVSDTQCVYVGHGCSAYQVNNAAGYALVKFMFNSVGTSICNIDHYSPWAGKITYSRNSKTEDGSALGFFNVPFDSASTFKAIALSLMGKTDPGVFTTVDEILQFNLIEIHRADNDVTDSYYLLKSFNMQHLRFHFTYSSSLAIQNTTQSGVGAAATPDVSHVAINPVKGTLYMSKNWLAGFVYKIRGLSNESRALNLSPSAFICTKGNGNIKTTYASLKLAAPHDDKFKKPPMGWEFDGNIKTARQHLQPGSIKKNKFVFKAMMSLSTYIEKYGRVLGGTDYNTDKFFFGPCNMFAFEKSLDSRADASDTIDFSFELNSICGCYVTAHRSNYTDPITTVGAGAV